MSEEGGGRAKVCVREKRRFAFTFVSLSVHSLVYSNGNVLVLFFMNMKPQLL